jgi:transcriptional regulator with XRE-family HTH domain
MTITLTQQEALGRVLEAGRVLVGLDQAGLGSRAGLSGATISNVENGNDAKPETIKAIRAALRKSGVTISFDKTNCLAVAAISFAEPDDDDE